MFRKLWCWLVGTNCRVINVETIRVFDPENTSGNPIAFLYLTQCERCGTIFKKKVSP